MWPSWHIGTATYCYRDGDCEFDEKRIIIYPTEYSEELIIFIYLLALMRQNVALGSANRRTPARNGERSVFTYFRSTFEYKVKTNNTYYFNQASSTEPNNWRTYTKLWQYFCFIRKTLFYWIKVESQILTSRIYLWKVAFICFFFICWLVSFYCFCFSQIPL